MEREDGLEILAKLIPPKFWLSTYMISRMKTWRTDTNSHIPRWIFSIAICSSRFVAISYADCCAIDRSPIRFFTSSASKLIWSSFWWRLNVYARDILAWSRIAMAVSWPCCRTPLKTRLVEWISRAASLEIISWTFWDAAPLFKAWMWAASRIFRDWFSILIRLPAQASWDKDTLPNFSSMSILIFPLCFSDLVPIPLLGI